MKLTLRRSWFWRCSQRRAALGDRLGGPGLVAVGGQLVAGERGERALVARRHLAPPALDGVGADALEDRREPGDLVGHDPAAVDPLEVEHRAARSAARGTRTASGPRPRGRRRCPRSGRRRTRSGCRSTALRPAWTPARPPLGGRPGVVGPERHALERERDVAAVAHEHDDVRLGPDGEQVVDVVDVVRRLVRPAGLAELLRVGGERRLHGEAEPARRVAGERDGGRAAGQLPERDLRVLPGEPGQLLRGLRVSRAALLPHRGEVREVHRLRRDRHVGARVEDQPQHRRAGPVVAHDEERRRHGRA